MGVHKFQNPCKYWAYIVLDGLATVCKSDQQAPNKKILHTKSEDQNRNEVKNMDDITRIADALERIADKLDMLAETSAEIEQDLDALAECTGYIAPPVYAPVEAKGAHYFRVGGSVDAG